jgi:hypothetical protein
MRKLEEIAHAKVAKDGKGTWGGLMLLAKEADNKDVDEKTEKKESEG